MASLVPVSVIVVSYNTREHLRRCLKSLVGEAAEVIVVDNASKDGSPDVVAEEFPKVKLIRSPHNVGFGTANNRGMEAATQPLVLFLNSDAEAERGSIATLASVFDDPNVIAAGGRLYDDRGLQSSCCSQLTLWRVFCEQTALEKLFPGSIFDSYWLSRRLAQRGPGPHEVAQVMGACLMMRPVERFDESFFLYCEDTELCLRLARRGRIFYVDAPFRHALGTSTERNRGWAVAMYNLGKEMYFAKHRGLLAKWTCLFLNRSGGFLRLLAGILRRDKQQIKIFDEVVFGPLAGPALPPDAHERP